MKHIHVHTAYSINDSTMTIKRLVDRLLEMNSSGCAITNHGNVNNWIKHKQAFDNAGLKYVHGVEIYVTKSLETKERDNYHMVLLAKNWNGVKEINSLVSIASLPCHSYYTPRISMEEVFNISDNVIITSACLGGVFKNIDESSDYFDQLMKRIDYLEVQHHEHRRQATHNKKMAAYSKRYNKPLIYGGDSHEANEAGANARSIIMASKGIKYDDEDKFDIVMRDEAFVLDALNDNRGLSPAEVTEAISNTDKVFDSIEDFYLDDEFKYPDIYENADVQLRDRVEKKLEALIDSGYVLDSDIEEYVERIEEELRVFTKIGMNSFILFMSDLILFCDDNDIEIGYCRGSSGGSLVAFLSGVTDLDSIKWNTNFERFANEDRISLGDIDFDVPPSDRPKVYNYILEKSGEGKASYISTFSELSGKSAIEVIGRGTGLSQGYITEVKREFDKDESVARSKHKDVFNVYDDICGAIASRGIHAAGMISGPTILNTNVGTIYDKSREASVSSCDMKALDSLNYTKFDVLSLCTLEIIRDTYKMAGLKMPKSFDIEWDRKDVMDSILDSPVGIFQLEASSAFSYTKKFKPQSVQELALLSAILRPGAASFRDSVIDRKSISYEDDRINFIMKDTYGYMVFQEQTIEFLKELCGFSGGQADIVRRAIGKKDEKLLSSMLPAVRKGFLDNGGNEDVIDSFMTVLIQSAEYQFNHSHAVGYSMITYMAAYVRMEHPIEFVVSYLNNSSNDEDLKSGTKLAGRLSVKINNPKYGFSSSKYAIKDGEVYKGIGSVVNVSSAASNGLMEAYSEGTNTFMDMLDVSLAKKDVNKTKIETLIKIDFFSEFGKAKKLARFYSAYHKYKGKKTLKKEALTSGVQKIIDFSLLNGYYGFSETEKQYKFNDKSLLDGIWKAIPDTDYEDIDKIIHQMSFLNYIQDSELKGRHVGIVEYVSPKGYILVKMNNGEDMWYGISDELEKIVAGECIDVTSAAVNARSGRRTLVSFNKIELLRRKK